MTSDLMSKILGRSGAGRWLAACGAVLALGMLAPAAQAQTTIRMLHVETNPETVELWKTAGRDFEAAKPA